MKAEKALASQPKPSQPGNSALLFLESEDKKDEFIEQLGRAGINTISFSDPRAFLVQVRAEKPTLCLVNMEAKQPEIAAALIKTLRTVLGKNLLILGLTKQGNLQGASEALAKGATDVLEWPLGTVELKERIARVVASRGPALHEVPIPELAEWFFDYVCPSLFALNGVLESFDNLESKIEFYSRKLKSQKEPFTAMVKLLRRSEEEVDFIRAIRLYGTANTRNLLVAQRLSETTGSKSFQWSSKTGMLKKEPVKILEFAVRAINHFGEESRYSQVAFNAGLVFDILGMMADLSGDRKVGLRRQIEAAFQETIAQADVGAEQAKKVKDLIYEKYIFPVLLIREAGKILIAIHHTNYPELLVKFKTRGYDPAIQHILEQEKYSISHNVLGALLCQLTPNLAVAHKAVLFCDYPYMLSGIPAEKDSFALASLCQKLTIVANF